ncbi:TonB-dependent siderophore receptor [Acinetobacter qingfengensis]|uniref:Ligand-gated channel protein n=1 Tax=Acinetobacter qingfengensis TaxID=1262585 RepID=A0A1E7QXC9_9GAMM|nr:TonB-dependent siderophore receptor [Acinetobacter qingfengensis]KAA8731611.1 TonB-dependent siderophore receptor [Acinetobacter qingfengensis]OEY91715.1 ligand-gated channel protein [Acinetobacter qingfengensis]
MIYQRTTLSLMLTVATMLHLNHASAETNVSTQQSNVAVLPTLQIEAMDDGDPVKTYVDYKQANVTRNGLDKKDIPQTVDTIDVSKYKLYGANDLSIMLQGTPGVTTAYDMRGDGITLRGFSADNGDIYRNGVRESGQYRRSTANVERIEILKGPASVLYGRSQGGGVINLVTKTANFESRSNIGAYVGSYDNVGGTIDLNKVVTDNWAIRLVGEKFDTNSFRSGIGTKQNSISPSVTYRSDDEKLTWTAEATYDKMERVPDRGPNYSVLLQTGYPINIKQGYAQNGDIVTDETKSARLDLKYEFLPDWKFHWGLSYRNSFQNFDHFYLGSYCSSTSAACAGHIGQISQVYYWQETETSTLTNTWDIAGEFNTGAIKHNVMIGTDWTKEERNPKLANQYVGSNGTTLTSIYGWYDPATGKLSNTRNGGTLSTRSYSEIEATSLGIFIQDLISLTPEFKLMLGGRYDTYDMSSHQTRNANKDVDVYGSYDGESFSPNAGIVWQPTATQSFYASYSKSFSPYGGRGWISVIDETAEDLKPENNTQYEIGVKSDWFDNRLNTQLSAYQIKKDNMRGRAIEDDDSSPIINIGERESKGIEFSFIGKATDNVFIRGGYGYTDTEITKNIRTPANEGNRFSNSAKNTGNLFIRYLPTDRIYGEIGATYVGSFYTSDANTTKIDGWTRLDAAIGYKDDHWGATFAVNNLTNKEYWRTSSMPGTPRNYLFRLNYYFD